MRFWDSCALVPLLVEEASTARLTRTFTDDPDVMAWCGTPIECVSALARLERDGMLAADQVGEAVRRLGALESSWTEIQAVARVRQTAIRFAPRP